MEDREQDNREQEKPFDLPLLTKAGIVAAPGLPIGLIELLAHGGPTPIALTGFALALIAAKSPWLVEKAGENEHILLTLSLRDDLRVRLDAFTHGYFSKQIAKLRQEQPNLFLNKASAKEAFESPTPSQTIDLEEMEPLIPRGNRAANPVDTASALFPRYSANVTMRLGQVVSTGQRFDPHINQFLGDGGVVAGQPGVGKSNFLGLMATGAANCGMSTIVIDYKREFYTLEEVVPRFLRAGHTSFASEVGENYFILTDKTASELADIIMSYGFLAVIDVPSYAGQTNELASAITALLNALMNWSQTQAEENRLPCMVFVDEAHNFWPEERKLSAFSTMDKANFDALQSAHNRITTGGRSYGFTMIVATQRIANIAKWAIATLQIKVIMRHRELNDLKRCEQEAGDAANSTVVKSLEKGQGIVIGLTDEPLTVQFDRQPARHVSITPTIERTHEKRAAQAQPHISQILTQHAPVVRSVASTMEGDLLNQAREIFAPGLSHHDLARLLGTDKETAIELFKLLKRLPVSSVSTGGNAGNTLETEMETRQQARPKVITGVFANAASLSNSTEVSSREDNTTTVSNDIRETIRRARNRKPPMSHREIAGLVGLTGRSYKLYQQVCREMSLMSAAEAAEQ